MHGHGGGGCGEARGVELGPQVPAASAPPPPTLSFPMEEARAALSPRRAADVSCHVLTVLRTHALLKGGGRERRGCHHDRRSPGDRRVTAHGCYGSQCGEKCRDGRHDRAPLAAGGSPFLPPSATAAVGTGWHPGGGRQPGWNDVRAFVVAGRGCPDLEGCVSIWALQIQSFSFVGHPLWRP